MQKFNHFTARKQYLKIWSAYFFLLIFKLYSKSLQPDRTVPKEQSNFAILAFSSLAVSGSALCMLGTISCFCCHLHTFLKMIFFFKKFFQEHYQSTRGSNGLDPDQDQQSGPDLGPNCLQRLLADDLIHC